MKWRHLATTMVAVTLIGLSLVRPRPAAAQTVVFQDDFSHGFEKWEAMRDSSKYWSIKDGQAEAYIPWGSTLAEMVPKDAYWNGAWQDLEYEVEYTPLEGLDKNISFSFEDVFNWYEIHFTEHWWSLAKVDEGWVEFDASGEFTMENGKTYKMVIRFNKGLIQLYINGVQIANELDWKFNHNYGKIGIKAGTGAVAPTRVRYDNVVVRLIEPATPPPPTPTPTPSPTPSPAPAGDLSLNVSPFKQTDAAWANQEYDTATKWSDKPTIHRWGCAMTSLAMVMRFHGLTTMPDGQPVNPSTLNAWLKSQADGYLNGGSLNWQAATRLTRLISEKFGTVKLEYARREGSDLATAKADITAKKPVVLQIDGHFLVGDGVTADGSDLLIKDPAYAYAKFGQHHKPLLSTRQFQPSHTDLSYLLLTHQPGLQLQLLDANQQAVAGVQTFTDRLSDQVDGSGERNPELVQHQLAKPASGRYVLAITKPQLGKYDLDVYAYDAAANPTKLHLSGWAGPQPQYFALEYRQDGASQLTPLLGWAELRQDLQTLRANGEINHQPLYEQLDRLAASGQAATTSLKKAQQWLSTLEQITRVSGSKMTTSARAYLLQRSATLEEVLAANLS